MALWSFIRNANGRIPTRITGFRLWPPGCEALGWVSAGGPGTGSLLLLTSSGVPVGQNKRWEVKRTPRGRECMVQCNLIKKVYNVLLCKKILFLKDACKLIHLMIFCHLFIERHMETKSFNSHLAPLAFQNESLYLTKNYKAMPTLTAWNLKLI